MNSTSYTIRIFVPDGDPEGIRIIDRMNWTGKGIVFPRLKWSDAKSRKEFTEPGTYLLTGYSSEDDDLPTIYVRQGDPVRDRIESHFKNKESIYEELKLLCLEPDSQTKKNLETLKPSTANLINSIYFLIAYFYLGPPQKDSNHNLVQRIATYGYLENADFAKKFLKKLDDVTWNRIIQKIEDLRKNPFPHKVERVKGRKEKTFRIRVGDYRILYLVFHDRNLLFISKIDKRPRAY